MTVTRVMYVVLLALLGELTVAGFSCAIEPAPVERTRQAIEKAWFSSDPGTVRILLVLARPYHSATDAPSAEVAFMRR
jgi:hypothetical protein